MLPDDLLLALDNVSLSTSAGIVGRGFCAVRLLDRVSLAIHAGQLVLLRGGFENGSAALLSVIAGDERIRSRLTGDRMAAPGLVVRSGCIPAAVVAPLVHCWTSADNAPFGVRHASVAEARPPSALLYLLRASSAVTRDDLDAQHWVQWCAQLKQRGGTMVIAEKHNALREEERFSLDVSLPSHTRVGDVYDSSRVRNRSFFTTTDVQQVRETQRQCRCQRPVVRILQFGFGRLFREDAHRTRLCHTCLERTLRVS